MAKKHNQACRRHHQMHLQRQGAAILPIIMPLILHPYTRDVQLNVVHVSYNERTLTN